MTAVISEGQRVTVISVGIQGPQGPPGESGVQGATGLPGPNDIGGYGIALGPSVLLGDVLSFDGAVWTNKNQNQLTDGGNF